MVGFSESQQVSAISKVFADSYKSPLSVIVLDNIERLLGEKNLHLKVFDSISRHWVRLGPCWPALLERGSTGSFGASPEGASEGMMNLEK